MFRAGSGCIGLYSSGRVVILAGSFAAERAEDKQKYGSAPLLCCLILAQGSCPGLALAAGLWFALVNTDLGETP